MALYILCEIVPGVESPEVEVLAEVGWGAASGGAGGGGEGGDDGVEDAEKVPGLAEDGN